MSKKTEITRSEYLQLVGLVMLARKHDEIVRDCNRAAEEIVDEEQFGCGHISDACEATTTIDDALRLMGITVKEA